MQNQEPEKRLSERPTDEMIEHLFPKEVLELARQIGREKPTRKRPALPPPSE